MNSYIRNLLPGATVQKGGLLIDEDVIAVHKDRALMNRLMSLLK